MKRGQNPRVDGGRFGSVDVIERFHSYVRRGADCWEWIGVLDRAGYGQFFVDGHKELPHRFAFELFVGPIPDELAIDHLCRNRRCVRPDHLEAVTTAENNRRAMRRTCRQGHPFNDANTRYVIQNGSSYRVCRICQAQAQRRWRTRKAA